MDLEHIDGPDGLSIHRPRDDGYRACSTCGGDCEPEPSASNGLGVRIVYVRPEHGPQSMVVPFSDMR